MPSRTDTGHGEGVKQTLDDVIDNDNKIEQESSPRENRFGTWKDVLLFS